jgi:hypothetical protein
VRRKTKKWEELIQNFKVTFNFEVESPLVDAILQIIRGIFFMEKGQVELVHTYNVHRESTTSHKLLECYNITEDNKDNEDLRNV